MEKISTRNGGCSSSHVVVRSTCTSRYNKRINRPFLPALSYFFSEVAASPTLYVLAPKTFIPHHHATAQYGSTASPFPLLPKKWLKESSSKSPPRSFHLQGAIPPPSVEHDPLFFLSLHIPEQEHPTITPEPLAQGGHQKKGVLDASGRMYSFFSATRVRTTTKKCTCVLDSYIGLVTGKPCSFLHSPPPPPRISQSSIVEQEKKREREGEKSKFKCSKIRAAPRRVEEEEEEEKRVKNVSPPPRAEPPASTCIKIHVRSDIVSNEDSSRRKRKRRRGEGGRKSLPHPLIFIFLLA